MKKIYRNCELKEPQEIEAVKKYCHAHKIYYEASDAGDGYVHFEILCTSEI